MTHPYDNKAAKLRSQQRSCCSKGTGDASPASNFCGYGQWAYLRKWGNLYRFPLLATLWQVLFRRLIRTSFINSSAEDFRETGGPLFLHFEIRLNTDHDGILNGRLRAGCSTTWQAWLSGTTLTICKISAPHNFCKSLVGGTPQSPRTLPCGSGFAVIPMTLLKPDPEFLVLFHEVN